MPSISQISKPKASIATSATLENSIASSTGRNSESPRRVPMRDPRESPPTVPGSRAALTILWPGRDIVVTFHKAAFRRSRSTEMKLAVLAMLGADPAHRPGCRAHHHGLGLDHVAPKLHAAQHGAVGDPGRGEQAIAFDQIL